MKKFVILLAGLLLTSCSTSVAPVAQIGIVTDCADINSVSSANSAAVLQCLDGSAGVAIADLRGPLIVNVWGSWCGPCKEEIPYFVDFYRSAKGSVAMLGIAVEEASIRDAQKFVVAQGITWPNLFDKTGTTRGTFGIGVPVTWFIDQTGAVVYKKIGPVKSAAELRELTTKYLKVSF